jgi:hypothetical protein
MSENTLKTEGLLGPKHQRFHVPLLALAIIALSTTMCTRSSSSGGSEADTDVLGTLEAMQVELDNAKATAEAASGAVAPAATSAGQALPTEQAAPPAPGQRVEDSFDSDIGTFVLGENVQIQNGALLVGPFEQCAEDVASFDAPVNCIAVCQTCGTGLVNYHMELDIAFADGLSDKGFGVLLRFDDQNGDMMLDREDYYLDIAFNAFENEWSIFVHIPDEVNPWFRVKSGPAGLRARNAPNKLEVTASNNGRIIDIFLNDSRLTKLTADAPQPGETLIEEWAESGAVGFTATGRRVQARYDNFLLEPLP